MGDRGDDNGDEIATSDDDRDNNDEHEMRLRMIIVMALICGIMIMAVLMINTWLIH